MFSLSSNTHVTLRSKANLDLFSDNTPYIFTNQFCATLNYNSKIRVALSEIHFPLNFRNDLKQYDISQIFVITDLVDDSIVGNKRLSILKVITINKHKNPKKHSQAEIFQNLFFYPITRNSINNVTIKITDTNGNILNQSKPGKYDETFIVLNFK